MDQSTELNLSNSDDENKTILLDDTFNEQTTANSAAVTVTNESSTESEEPDVNKQSTGSLKVVDITDLIEQDSSNSNAATVASSKIFLIENSDEEKKKPDASGDTDHVKGDVDGDKKETSDQKERFLSQAKFEDSTSDEDDHLEIVKYTKNSDALSEEDVEETIIERLIGLTEMFPNGVRNLGHSVVTGTFPMIKKTYGVTRTISWIFFSSLALLVVPVSLEKERYQGQREIDRQMLLGGGKSASGLGMAPAPVSK